MKKRKHNWKEIDSYGNKGMFTTTIAIIEKCTKCNEEREIDKIIHNK